MTKENTYIEQAQDCADMMHAAPNLAPQAGVGEDVPAETILTDGV